MEATLEAARPQRGAVHRLDGAVLDRAGAAARGAGAAADGLARWSRACSDDAKAFTLEHYRQLFVDPSFVKPLVTTLWTSAAVGVLCVDHGRADGVAGRAHRPAGQAAAAHADSRVVRHAAVSRRVRLGAARRTQRGAHQPGYYALLRREAVRRRRRWSTSFPRAAWCS